MARRPVNVALVGATGAVGREILSVLESRKLSIGTLEIFASTSSAGEEIEFDGMSLSARAVTPDAFDEIDIVLMAAPAEVSRELTPQAIKAGALVIDCSSARAGGDDPLVVPEVNPEALAGARDRRLVLSPSPATVALTIALRPLQLEAGLRRVVVSTYESTSCEGQRGMEALNQEVLRLYRRLHLEPGDEELASDEYESPYPHQIAFNVIPHVGAFLADGTTSAEVALIDGSRRILAQPDLRVSATCVRVPSFAGLALSVNLETTRPLSPDAARALLSTAPGVVLEDEPDMNLYPMPFPHAGADEVFVGRVRRDPSVDHGLNLWIVTDGLRKGSALNAVGILELLIERHAVAG